MTTSENHSASCPISNMHASKHNSNHVESQQKHKHSVNVSSYLRALYWLLFASPLITLSLSSTYHWLVVHEEILRAIERCMKVVNITGRQECNRSQFLSITTRLASTNRKKSSLISNMCTLKHNSSHYDRENCIRIWLRVYAWGQSSTYGYTIFRLSLMRKSAGGGEPLAHGQVDTWTIADICL